MKRFARQSRFLGAVGILLAVLVSCVAGPVSAQVAPRLVTKNVHFLKNVSDSLRLQLNGAPATNHTLDTLQVFDAVAEGVTFPPFNTVNTSAPAGIARLDIVSNSGTVASTDSLFYAVDISADMVHWQIATAYTGITFATANDASCSTPLLVDTDAQYNLSLARYWRIRLHSDASGSSTFPNATVYLTFWKRGEQ
jgi:hypothetical protein